MDETFTKEEVSSLLSSQEQKHKKEIEELIGEIPKPGNCGAKNEHCACADDSNVLENLPEQLKSKYLTKGKE